MKFDWRLVMVVVLACSPSLSLMGCGSADTQTVGPVTPAIPGNHLRTAPARIEVMDQEYELRTRLWRDFMPISPPDGKPLIAVVQIVERKVNPIAPELKLEYLWVINGSRIWSTIISDEVLPPSATNELNGIARNGPKWGPRIQVDVVVGFRRGNGSLKLLRAPDQWISRTD